MDDAWSDLVMAIEILSQHRTGPFPFHCEHDELFVMSDPDKYTPQQIMRLHDLGFEPSTEGHFYSSRYGSA